MGPQGTTQVGSPGGGETGIQGGVTEAGHPHGGVWGQLDWTGVWN